MSEDDNGSLRYIKDGKVIAEYTTEGVHWSPHGRPLEEIKFYEPPKYVGGYRLGGPMGLQVNMVKKPCWFHRTMMKLILGWEWVGV